MTESLGEEHLFGGFAIHKRGLNDISQGKLPEKIRPGLLAVTVYLQATRTTLLLDYLFVFLVLFF